MTATVIELLEATRAHLRAFELPTPWNVSICPSQGQCAIEVQLECLQLPEVVAALLAWADTLTEVTAGAWRVPDGASVHLSITGQVPGGALLRVYAGIPHTQHGPGANLDPDTKTTLLLSALRPHASSQEVTRS